MINRMLNELRAKHFFEYFVLLVIFKMKNGQLPRYLSVNLRYNH